MVHWTCDRCEKPVIGEPMTLLCSVNLQQKEPAIMHLCGPCASAFGDWVAAGMPEPAPAPARPEGDDAGQ